MDTIQTVHDWESCTTQIGNQMLNTSSIKHWSLNGHLLDQKQIAKPKPISALKPHTRRERFAIHVFAH